MLKAISHISLFVKDQDASLAFYQKLGFKIHTDANFEDIRWLTLCVPGQENVELVLMKAEGKEEQALVGKQAGTKPFLSLESSDCKKDCANWANLGIEIVEQPDEQPWGISAAIKDVDGNLIYVCQPC